MIGTFDLADPLPSGVLALDASAGTGKTFTLTALATRWLVEGGNDPAGLLVVTFTRAAAEQLRSRIRTDLRDAATALDAAVDGRPPPRTHDWIRALTDVDPGTLAERRRAAAAALVGFERATVSTLHAFCRSALVGLGMLGDVGGRGPATASDRDRDDIVRDLLGTRLAADPAAFAVAGDADSLDPEALEERLVDAVKRALNDPGATLVPGAPTGGFGRRVEPEAAGAWSGLVATVVAELRRRLDARAELDFGQLVARLDEVVGDPDRGPVAVRALRDRYRFVLVDEMQDTDAVQWRVLHRSFRADPERLGPPAAMVMVGDPKQSIYRFRGADVHAYLRAKEDADDVRAIRVNHRSSPALIGALDLLLRGATFGSDLIAYDPVTAPATAGPVLAGEGGDLELRWVPRHPSLMTDGKFRAGRSDALVLEDLAAHAVELLRTARTADAPDRPGRPLVPGDLAVLVGSGDEAEAVIAALRAVELPAVRPRAGDVLTSEAVEQWRLLLAALEAPHRRDRVRALMLSWFVAAPLEALGDAEVVETLQLRVDAWRRDLGRRGVVPFLVRLLAEPDVTTALARVGERGRTDLEHVGELLHGAVGGGPAPAGAVLEALDTLVRTSGTADRLGDDPAVRRIETDGSAVQVMTFHAAKGLEFPVVLLPITTKRGQERRLRPYAYRGPDGPVIDVASWTDWRWADAEEDEPGADRADRIRLAFEADDGDRARVLYVALTRARGRLVVWWASRPDAEDSLLARLLFAPRDAAGALLPLGPEDGPSGVGEVKDDETVAALDGWAARSDGAIRIVRVPEAIEPVRWTPPRVEGGAEPTVARLSRAVREAEVRRWSFSSMRGALRPPDDDEELQPAPQLRDDDRPPEVTPGNDEEYATTPPPPDRPSGAPPLGRLVDLVGGTAVGTVVHEVLEVVEFTAPDLDAEVRRHLEAVPPRRLALLEPDLDRGDLLNRVARGLVAALETPLDQVARGLCLRDLGPDRRLAEPPFDLPLGDTRTPLPLGAVAGAVAARLPASGVRDGFAALAEPGAAPEVAGWLTGVADLVVRLPDGRYAVLDHKTNRLTGGRPGQVDPPQRYDQPMLLHTARHDLYMLQGLLYLVALHRWLDRRDPGYDPEAHLGGFGLLFLRGMAGPGTPRDAEGRRDGVWWWAPPAEAVVAAARVLELGVGS